MSKIHSVPGLFGGEEFYDENGNRVGYSVPGLFGGENIRLDRDPFAPDPGDTDGPDGPDWD